MQRKSGWNSLFNIMGWSMAAVAGSVALSLYAQPAEPPSDPATAPTQPPAATEPATPETAPSAQEATGESVRLGPKFTAGSVSVFEQVSAAKGSQSFDDQTFPNDNTTILVIRVECVSVDEAGVATVTLKYDRIALAGDSMFLGQYNVDSDDPNLQTTGPNIAAIFDTVTQMKVTAKVAPNGKVTELTGAEEIFNQMQSQDLLKALTGPFSKEATTQTLESFWLVGEPGPDRQVGATWRETNTTPTWFGNLVVESDFTVSSADAEKAVVDLLVNLKAERSIRPTDPDQDMSEIQEFNWESPPCNGQVIWDRTRHELMERTSRVSFKMTVLQQPLFDTGQQTVITQQDVVTTFKRVGMK